MSAKLAIGEQRKTIEEAARLQQQEAEAKRQQAATTTAATVPTVSGGGAAMAAQAPKNVPPGQPQLITNSQPEPEVAYQPPAPVPISTPVPPPQPFAQTPRPIPAPKPVAAHQPVALAPKPITRATLPTPSRKAVTLALKTVPASKPIVKAPLPVTQKPNPSWEIASQNAIFSWHNRTTPATPTLVSSTPTEPTVNAAVGVLTSSTTNNGAYAIAGQQVAAQLLTPIQILQGQSHQPVVLKLAQAIVDTDGKVAIAAGTQVMADIHIHDNGMLEIGKVVANGRELSQGSFILQGADRQPLLAQVKKFGEGEVRQRDLLAFLGGALQGIGEEMTQPQTQTVLGAGGIVQSTNPQGNIVGAVLKGGFTPVNQQWLARNQAAIAKINSATSIWFLPTTTQINLVVAQPF